MGTCSPSCPGGTGRALSPSAIGTLLLQANPGLTGSALRSAATRGIAIALAESGGHPGACNHYTDPSGAVQNVYGLWQISTVHGTGTSPCDPQAAAGLFWQLSAHGTNWSPWSGSAYLPHMPAAIVGYRRAAVGVATNAAPAAGVIAGDLSSGLPDPLSAIKSIGDAVIFFVKFITSPNTWLRVGEVLAGAILVLFGLWILSSQTKLGQQVNGAAGGAAKVAAAA